MASNAHSPVRSGRFGCHERAMGSLSGCSSEDADGHMAEVFQNAH